MHMQLLAACMYVSQINGFLQICKHSGRPISPIFTGCRVYKYLVDTSLSNLSSLEAGGDSRIWIKKRLNHDSSNLAKVCVWQIFWIKYKKINNNNNSSNCWTDISLISHQTISLLFVCVFCVLFNKQLKTVDCLGINSCGRWLIILNYANYK